MEPKEVHARFKTALFLTLAGYDIEQNGISYVAKYVSSNLLCPDIDVFDIVQMNGTGRFNIQLTAKDVRLPNDQRLASLNSVAQLVERELKRMKLRYDSKKLPPSTLSYVVKIS